jgi:dTDP-4-amino-4,6-dideoxygalactose transaminase
LSQRTKIAEAPPPEPPSAGRAEPIDKKDIVFVDLKAQQACIRPSVDRAIARVLDHGQFVMGPEVGQLEQQLAQWSGARHVISCSSGTDALLIAMMAKGVGPGDAVLCPAFTYAATAEAIALLGATPVFVDIDADSFNIDPGRLEAGLSIARSRSLRPAGLIAVDLFGRPADYGLLEDFAGAHGLWLLADAAQSFGASVQGRQVGTFGDFTATSFFPSKPLGCYGDGGAVFTNSSALAERMISIRFHGIGREKYDFVRIGLNGRLDTLQAAILLEKLTIFAGEFEQRQAVARRYNAGLAEHAVVPRMPGDTNSSWAQYTLRIGRGKRDGVMAALKARGVPTNVYYRKPLHLQPAYRDYPVAAGGVPVTEQLSREVVSLPIHPYLSETQQDHIIACVRDAV